MEQFQRIQLFADAEEFDGLSRHRPNRKQRPAARIAFHFCENDPAQTHALIELGGHRDGILPGHCIRNQQDFIGLHRRFHGNELIHEFVIHMQAAAGIEHHQVKPLFPSALDAGTANADYVVLRRPRVVKSMEVDLQIPSDTGQLVSGRGTARVGRHEQHPLALLLKEFGEFAACRGLA